MPVRPDAGWRIYNVVGSVKYFLNTPHPRRAERLDGVPGARIARAEPVVLFITRSLLNGGAARATLDKRLPETSTYF
jgi:hypothetical protein